MSDISYFAFSQALIDGLGESGFPRSTPSCDSQHYNVLSITGFTISMFYAICLSMYICIQECRLPLSSSWFQSFEQWAQSRRWISSSGSGEAGFPWSRRHCLRLFYLALEKQSFIRIVMEY